MEKEPVNRALLDFIDASPNSFYAVRNLCAAMEKEGFTPLRERETWTLEPGRGYYVTRNGSALIAFRLPRERCEGFQIMASHSDSPALKLKVNAAMDPVGGLVRLNVERYGGMILSTWFDRPLSVSGRVMVRAAEGVETRLVNVERDLLVIPSLAIHMDRSVNEGHAFNVQKELTPVLGADAAALPTLIAEAAGAEPADVLDTDLFLYPRQRGVVAGAAGELLVSPRLDDLQCAFASAKGLLLAEPKRSAAVCCVFDNEEVGSGTRQGAASTFLKDVLRRIIIAGGGDDEAYLRALSSGFLLSADNVHGMHPNYPEKADPTNRPVLNGGVVIKYNASQKYTTDAVSGALTRLLCERAGVPVQTYFNRSDIAGGSTLGHISSAQVPVRAADVGLAQLAMHSACETGGAEDTARLVETARELYSTSLLPEGDGAFRLL